MIEKRILRLGLLLLVIGCGGETGEDPSGKTPRPLTVYTVNYPLAFFAERIGGEHVEVVFPAPPDEDPAYWNPGPATIARYQGADLILLNGAGYAGWLERASLPMTRTTNTSEAFADRYIPVEESLTHTHGPGGEHSHRGVAFTTWLDSGLALEQARAVADALVRARPEHGGDFEAGYAELAVDLKSLDGRMANLARDLGDTPLLFSHPVYQYLIRRCHLNARSVHWEPDEVPTEAMWRELEEILTAHPSKWMIWEGEPRPETVRRLRERGIESLVFDPCAGRPASGDYLSVMTGNADRLEQIRP